MLALELRLHPHLTSTLASTDTYRDRAGGPGDPAFALPRAGLLNVQRAIRQGMHLSPHNRQRSRTPPTHDATMRTTDCAAKVLGLAA